jgi:hypothetical protein
MPPQGTRPIALALCGPQPNVPKLLPAREPCQGIVSECGRHAKDSGQSPVRSVCVRGAMQCIKSLALNGRMALGECPKFRASCIMKVR